MAVRGNILRIWIMPRGQIQTTLYISLYTVVPGENRYCAFVFYILFVHINHSLIMWLNLVTWLNLLNLGESTLLYTSLWNTKDHSNMTLPTQIKRYVIWLLLRRSRDKIHFLYLSINSVFFNSYFHYYENNEVINYA